MIDFYGLEKTLALSEGMFSFCLYNRNSKKLFWSEIKWEKNHYIMDLSIIV